MFHRLLARNVLAFLPDDDRDLDFVDHAGRNSPDRDRVAGAFDVVGSLGEQERQRVGSERFGALMLVIAAGHRDQLAGVRDRGEKRHAVLRNWLPGTSR